jgi:trigger factor
MQVNVEKLSPVLVEVQVQVPADRVRSEVEKAYSALQRTARIRGFRPGKAPRDVLAHLYGGRVHADVAQRLVDETLNKALAEQKVEPLSEPAIAPTELRPAEPFSYKARFEVRPEIASVKWEGLEVTRQSVAVTDDMVDAEIQTLRREHSTLQAPAEERAARKGDQATFTFRLEVDGELKTAEAQEIETEIGGGEVMKELDEALSGMRAGEAKDVELVFSDRHPTAEFRGKKGSFHLILKDVRERVFPEVDDELAKDCGEDTLEKLKAAQRAKIERQIKQRVTDDLAQQLVIELCKNNPVPVPPSLVTQTAQMTERDLVAAARRQGQRFDTSADMKARIRQDAEMKVRAGLIMAEIAREKEVRVTEDDIEKGYVELAETSGKNVAKIKAEYRDAKKRETLIGMIIEDKILDLVENAAKITEVTAPPPASSSPQLEAP